MEDPTTNAALPLDPTALLNTLASIADRRRESVQRLREQADWLEAHPLFAPTWTAGQLSFSTINWLGSEWWRLDKAGLVEQTRKALLDAAREMKRGQPIGAVKKSATDHFYGVTLTLPAGGAIVVTAARDNVCRIVETGDTEDVVTYDIPDDVREEYRRVLQKPVVERICDPLTIAAFESAEVAS